MLDRTGWQRQIFAPVSALWLLCTSILAAPSLADAQHSLKLWQRNYDHAPTLAFVQLALANSGIDWQLTPVDIADLQGAQQSLQQDQGIDILVTGVDTELEQRFLPIYVPLDRGLLGFRICLIAPGQQSSLNDINSAADFARLNIPVLLEPGWSDNQVMNSNQIPVQPVTPQHPADTVLDILEQGCFSRSVIEVSDELVNYPDLLIEQRLAMIYPMADIIYVAADKPELHQLLSQGLQAALENGSFADLFDELYAFALDEHNFYWRKLLVMTNPGISAQALAAINRYGVASFHRNVR